MEGFPFDSRLADDRDSDALPADSCGIPPGFNGVPRGILGTVDVEAHEMPYDPWGLLLRSVAHSCRLELRMRVRPSLPSAGRLPVRVESGVPAQNPPTPRRFGRRLAEVPALLGWQGREGEPRQEGRSAIEDLVHSDDVGLILKSTSPVNFRFTSPERRRVVGDRPAMALRSKRRNRLEGPVRSEAWVRVQG
jgi:hypothetical protein